MRALLIAVVLSVALSAAPMSAQTPAAPAPAAQPAPAATLRPFPDGGKVAYINIQRVANESTEGRAATGRVKTLTDKKLAELTEKNKQLAANQQKLQQGGSVMSETARAQLEKDVEKLNVDLQRFQQDSQGEVQELQQSLQLEFQKKLVPVIQQVATERNLHMIFSQVDAGIIWADNGLDLTNDVIKRFDAMSGTATAPKPATPPAKPPVD